MRVPKPDTGDDLTQQLDSLGDDVSTVGASHNER
jgi:hypothetical protein